MADPKKNPLIGAFRAPVPGAPPDTPAPPEAGKPPAAGAAKPIDEKKGQEAPKAPAGTTPKPADGKKEPEAPKAPADTSAKPADGKKEPEAPKAPADPLTKPTNEKKGPEAPKAPADTSAKPADGKKGQEAPKAPADTPAKPTNEKKGQEEPKAPTDTSAKPADGKKSPVSDPSKPKDEKEQEPRSPDLRFVALSKIKPLPGTYVKDEPRKDYSGLIADIKKNGLQKPVILRKSEKEDEFQLVDGFHRCKALEQAGMLEVRADVYEMSLAQASEYRKGHRDKPLMPVPGKLVPYPPEEPAKADKAPEAPAVGDEELPENLKIPLTKEGQPETVTTMKVAISGPLKGTPSQSATTRICGTWWTASRNSACWSRSWSSPIRTAAMRWSPATAVCAPASWPGLKIFLLSSAIWTGTRPSFPWWTPTSSGRRSALWRRPAPIR